MLKKRLEAEMVVLMAIDRRRFEEQNPNIARKVEERIIQRNLDELERLAKMEVRRV